MFQFKTLKVEEYRLALKNLELHYQNFMKDSPDSEMFGADDRLQAENGFQSARQHYDVLVQSLEQGGLTAEHSDRQTYYILSAIHFYLSKETYRSVQIYIIIGI